eukprot:4604624-Lingulodinium_polyedra.AAC.1
MDNATRHGADASPWFVTHGTEFEAMLFPFGARATFHPNEAQGASYRKFGAFGVSGVFARCELIDAY